MLVQDLVPKFPPPQDVLEGIPVGMIMVVVEGMAPEAKMALDDVERVALQ